MGPVAQERGAAGGRRQNSPSDIAVIERDERHVKEAAGEAQRQGAGGGGVQRNLDIEREVGAKEVPAGSPMRCPRRSKSPPRCAISLSNDGLQTKANPMEEPRQAACSGGCP